MVIVLLVKHDVFSVCIHTHTTKPAVRRCLKVLQGIKDPQHTGGTKRSRSSSNHSFALVEMHNG